MIPAVHAANFNTVRTLAQTLGDSYCLGIHPLYVQQSTDDDLQTLQVALEAHLAERKDAGEAARQDEARRRAREARRRAA